MERRLSYSASKEDLEEDLVNVDVEEIGFPEIGWWAFGDYGKYAVNIMLLLTQIGESSLIALNMAY